MIKVLVELQLLVLVPLQIIPDIVMSKTMFIIINYAIIAIFIVMNIYITYEIVRSYGPALTQLFSEETVTEEPSAENQTGVTETVTEDSVTDKS